MAKAWFGAAIALVIAGCGGSGNLAEQHLGLLADGKAGDAQQQYCSLADDLRVVSVSSYELKSEAETELGTEYLFGIDSPEVPSGELAIVVANSDDFFDFAVASNAQLQGALDSAADLTGEPAQNLGVPQREEYGQADTCIFLPFEQFKEE